MFFNLNGIQYKSKMVKTLSLTQNVNLMFVSEVSNLF